MFEEGLYNQVNMDISPIVIEQMKEKYKDLKPMRWELGNIKEMIYLDEEFDVIIDKSIN